MVAVRIESGTPEGNIAQALFERSSGNELGYIRLQHALRGKDSSRIAHILQGLTHFTTALHEADAAQVQDLVEAALAIDVCNLEQDALDAFALFCRNLCSAHAGYVERVFDGLVAKVFISTTDRRENVIDKVIEVVGTVLKVYPRAVRLILRVIRARYPHIVRKGEEHAAFAKSILKLATAFPVLRVGIVRMVFERLGIFEAMVLDVMDTENDLSDEALKLQLVLGEVLNFIDKQNDGVFEIVYDAFEGAILPIEETKIIGYAVIYTAMKENCIQELVERLRMGFFDSKLSPGLREKYLQHSSAIVVLSAAVSGNQALTWGMSISRWLNLYIDECIATGAAQVDCDIHRLFYCACCALMVTIVGRKDALLCHGVTHDVDILERMRLIRIFSCDMNPMAVCPHSIVTDFVRIAIENGATDLERVLEESKRAYTPSRTRYGSENRVSYIIRSNGIPTPETRKRLADTIRFEEASVQTENQGT